VVRRNLRTGVQDRLLLRGLMGCLTGSSADGEATAGRAGRRPLRDRVTAPFRTVTAARSRVTAR
jgi:hypothetical protein